MDTYLKNNFFRRSLLVLVGLPLAALLTMGNFPERSFLKEALSVLTILAFFQLLGQFFWARANSSAVRQLTMSRVMKYHTCIGYTFASVMLLHPLFVVIPRFLEAGVSPADAINTMITTFNTGVVLGMIAWCLLLILTLTSFWRKRLPMHYRSWRVFHGVLAILFTAAAVWHVIDLGRHASLFMSILLGVVTAGGVLLLVKSYLSTLNRCNGQ